MEARQLEGCFALLRAYWDRDWNEERLIVWAEAFTEFEVADVRDALVEMGRTEEFPSVAKFRAIARSVRTKRTLAERGMRHIPGTGFVREIGTGR